MAACPAIQTRIGPAVVHIEGQLGQLGCGIERAGSLYNRPIEGRANKRESHEPSGYAPGEAELRKAYGGQQIHGVRASPTDVHIIPSLSDFARPYFQRDCRPELAVDREISLSG